MSLRHFPSVRLLSTLVLALCFGVGTAESALADVHDGDATHEELVQFDGPDRHAVSHVAHGDELHGVHSEENSMGSAAGAHLGERSTDQPVHDQHACHDSHVHNGWFRSGDAPAATVSLRRLAGIAPNDRAASSRAPEPQLRPPIA